MASGETIRGLIDGYVTANRTTMTSSTVSVNYTVKAIVPSGSTLRVGYEYPASTQTSGELVNIQNSLGTYTKTFSGPFLPCQMRAKFNFIAGSYTENKVLKTRMNISGGTGYKTITASDVNRHNFSVVIVGLVLQVVVAPTGANVIIDPLFTLAALSSWPALAVGQYYRITTSVSGSTLTVNMHVWPSKADYDAGGSVIASGSRSVTIPTF